MTYQEKLQLPEWQKKRIEILERDNYSCKKCGFNNSKKNPLFTLDLEEFITNYKIQIQTIKNKEITFKFCSDDDYLLIDNLRKYYPKSSTWDSWNGNLKIKLDVETIKMNEWQNLGVAYYINTFHDSVVIFEWIKHPEFKNIILKNELHVHHKKYTQDKMPWQYENDSLTTLCNYCHQKTHEEEIIPYYSRYGNLICDMEICDRCNGSGFLSEFNYVQNGICFKCWGEGFDPIKSNFEN